MLKKRSGQSVILITLILSVVFSILLYTSLDLINRNTSVRMREIDRLLLDEVTSSSFAIIESALERRLWEPPPDNDCLKSETFSVTSENPTGPNWKVDVKYNLETRNFELVASGQYKNFKSRFKKQVRVADVSEYLLYSGGETPLTISQTGDMRSPSALIGKSRKIYSNGPLEIQGSINARSPTQPSNWNGYPENFPDEHGMILQGDRLQFKKGISYRLNQLSDPEDPSNPPGPPEVPNSPHLMTLLAPYRESNGPFWGQYGGGNLVVLSDPVLAENLRKTVEDPSLALVTRPQVSASVYPIALFGGVQPPLLAHTATDNGTYFNDSDRYTIIRYLWGGGNHNLKTANFTCLTKDRYNKHCSNSEHFPKGFAKWKADANLDGVLFTSDAVEVPVPEIGWDQLESLEEDAKLCGAVVDTPTDPYDDCPVWDLKFMKSYSLTGSKNCLKISKIKLDSLPIQNFNSNLYKNEEYRKRSLRRIVYLKQPTTITQNDPKGFFPDLIDPDVRSAISIWVVSEKLLTLQGYQSDLTSPLDVDPARARTIGFNTDAAEAVQPIGMTFLTPETVHLISPFYKPMTPELLDAIYPVSGGKIKAQRHNITDYHRWESDAYVYGYRTYRLKNLNLITSIDVNASKPFTLQGLWSGPDGTGHNRIGNQCMMTRLGHPLAPIPGISVADRSYVPAASSPLIASPNAPLPPLTSRFYGGSNEFADFYIPRVFKLQMSTPLAQKTSIVDYTGGRVHMNFNFTGHPTKADLVAAGYQRITNRYTTDIAGLFDLSDHGFQYDSAYNFQHRPADTPCVADNVRFLAPPHATELRALSPSLNDGGYTFVFKAADDNFKNLGGFTGLDLPMIESHR